MKMLLLLVFALSPYFSFSQQQPSDSLKIAILNQEVQNIQLHLDFASKKHNQSIMFYVLGAGGVIVGAFADMEERSRKPIMIGGGVTALVGFFINESAWKKIGLAGKKSKSFPPPLVYR